MLHQRINAISPFQPRARTNADTLSELGENKYRYRISWKYKSLDLRDQQKRGIQLRESFQKDIFGLHRHNPAEIQKKLLELSIKLHNTKSKKVYGYLKKDVKELIDSIVDLLAEDENISKLYDLWYGKPIQS